MAVLLKNSLIHKILFRVTNVFGGSFVFNRVAQEFIIVATQTLSLFTFFYSLWKSQ